MTKILCVVGARPNFMKIAPIMSALNKCQGMTVKLIHTGQHYDVAMNKQFFIELNIPQPDLDLEVGSASHAVQTAEIMRRFEPVIDKEQPQAVLVVGDVNSTIACALVATKKAIDVIHVEAGLRSFDRSMPEEVNRVLTDQISNLLFTTEKHAEEQLLREGISKKSIHFVGNVMIDTLVENLPKATPLEKILTNYDHREIFLHGGYAVLTLHRPSNVDNKAVLLPLLQELRAISEKIPLIFPVHPRAKQKIIQIF